MVSQRTLNQHKAISYKTWFFHSNVLLTDTLSSYLNLCTNLASSNLVCDLYRGTEGTQVAYQSHREGTEQPPPDSRLLSLSLFSDLTSAGALTDREQIVKACAWCMA